MGVHAGKGGVLDGHGLRDADGLVADGPCLGKAVLCARGPTVEFDGLGEEGVGGAFGNEDRLPEVGHKEGHQQEVVGQGRGCRGLVGPEDADRCTVD